MAKPTDTRRHRAETERNLMIGGLAILVIVGGGLILLFYGSGATISGLLCFSGVALVAGLLYLVLKLFERIAGE